MITPSFALTATERVLPKLAVDFTTAALDQRVTFTRTGNTATVVNSSGYVAPINADLPRFDFNPTTLVCKGLLIEEQRTNLFTYSNEFNNASWTKSEASITSNVTTSPAGTLTGSKFIESTANSQHRLYKVVSSTTNTNPYTISLFCKAAERTRIYIAMVEGATFSRQGSATFNLTDGTIQSVNSGSNGATGGSATITNYGNGWYRCSYTLTLGGADTAIFCDINLNNGSGISYTGDGTSGLYLYGAQLEAGLFSTSYIPTVASQVTRSADLATMTGANFSDWYSANQGTFVGTALPQTPITNTAGQVIMSADDGTSSNRIQIYRNANNGFYGVSQSPAAYSSAAGVWSINTTGKVAATFNAGSQFGAYQGVLLPASGSSASLPTTNVLHIGTRFDGTAFFNGCIQKIAFYQIKMLDAELQAFTT
jgi:hypothetical protein